MKATVFETDVGASWCASRSCGTGVRPNEVYRRQLPRTSVLGALALAAILSAMASRTYAQVSCSASIDPTVLTPPTIGTSYLVGDVLTVNLEMGVGTVQGGTLINISSVSHALDCIGPGTLIDLCVDETMKVAYLGDGTLSTDCGVAISSNVPGGGAATNIIVFTFAPTAQLPAGTSCNVTFNVQILEEPSADATPNRIEEASGFNGTCDNGLPGQARGGLAIGVLYCGDDDVNRPEETCDGTDPGTLGCTADDSGQPNACRGAGSNDECTCCGDGVIQATSNETCDPAGSPVGSPGETCRDDCTYCGDGVVDFGEACDDGNEVNGDACEADCTPSPICGDGIVGNTPGEFCDGAAEAPGVNCTDLCDAQCTCCGDGVRQTDEQCDGTQFEPGAPPSHGPCRSNCTFCGDGTVDPGEACDDGNSVDNDGCRNDCSTVTCGNNLIDPGEECDGTSAEACIITGLCLPDCTCDPGDEIPTVSEWGLLVMALLLLTGAKVYFRRRPLVA